MKPTHNVLAVAVLATLVPMAALAGTAIRDQVLNSSSVSTVQLTPGSTSYNGWAAWIQQQQTRPDIAQVVHGIGTITVTTSSGSSSAQAAPTMSGITALSAPAATTDPSPVVLPQTGTPGQTITITNKIPNGGEQVWTYTWTITTTSGESSGGWVLTSSGGCGNPNCGIVITNPG
ncbi:hypothetical protein [Dyella telluris]|uniref:Uncharacterized protein n=1 Tax=Dyella telluris TaxID=2763498 RepID=A0A7G8Q3J1_9GAMM|nr:hypothetical protein [Dyella telluris]QNK01349.1 hypothetical protein H8F01_20290 [Dyella telluris]